MNNNFSDDNGLERFLNSFSLFLIGSLRVTDGDRVPDISDNVPSRELLLIGNGGSSFWPNFSQSQEFEDGLADPLDRWSRRVGNLLANKMGGRAFFPFEGPPHRPFLSWASKTGQVASSRLSLFTHERFGLWHAYRFALALPKLRDESPVGDTLISPCLSCEDKPCLNACPVNAFAGASYRADLCMDYLVGDHTRACRELGCAARRACPVGKAFTYTPEQAKFHMDAFVKPRII
jgi:epoxyqueuosine reductase